MPIPFRFDNLLMWVAVYLVVAFFPGLVWFVLPPETLGQTVPVWGEQTIQIGQVLTWFPKAMVGAAVVTFVVGVLCGGLNALAVGFAARGDRPNASDTELWLADTLPSLFSTVRVALMLAGIAFVILSVVLTWHSIARGELANDITRILVALGSGAGLATGAAFYRE